MTVICPVCCGRKKKKEGDQAGRMGCIEHTRISERKTAARFFYFKRGVTEESNLPNSKGKKKGKGAAACVSRNCLLQGRKRGREKHQIGEVNLLQNSDCASALERRTTGAHSPRIGCTGYFFPGKEKRGKKKVRPRWRPSDSTQDPGQKLLVIQGFKRKKGKKETKRPVVERPTESGQKGKRRLSKHVITSRKLMELKPIVGKGEKNRKTAGQMPKKFEIILFTYKKKKKKGKKKGRGSESSVSSLPFLFPLSRENKKREKERVKPTANKSMTYCNISKKK